MVFGRDGDIGAVARRPQRDGKADAPAAAGDEQGFAGQRHESSLRYRYYGQFRDGFPPPALDIPALATPLNYPPCSTSRPKPPPPIAAGIAEAARILRDGGLVAFPTETVYGLGADATNGGGGGRDLRRKRPPAVQPADRACRPISKKRCVMSRCRPAPRRWRRSSRPGALTLVLPRRKNSPLSLLVSAGLDSVALRAPSHPAAIALLKETGRPVAGPSANKSGQVTATTAQHVADSLTGKVDFILDAGSATLGIESTVVGFDGDRPLLLRPGAIPRDEIEDMIGPAGSAGQPDPLARPVGQPLCAARRAAPECR